MLLISLSRLIILINSYAIYLVGQDSDGDNYYFALTYKNSHTYFHLIWGIKKVMMGSIARLAQYETVMWGTKGQNNSMKSLIYQTHRLYDKIMLLMLWWNSEGKKISVKLWCVQNVHTDLETYNISLS